MLNCSIQKLKQKDEKRKYFLEVITSKKAINKILNYLSLFEIQNLIILNKEIYSIFTGDKYNIYNKYLLRKYKGSYLLISKRKTEIKQLNQVIACIKFSDTLYKRFYKAFDIAVNAYFLISFFLGLVILPLLFGIKSKSSKNDLVLNIPLIIIWIISLLALVVDKILSFVIKKKISSNIDKSIEDINLELKKNDKLFNNMERRMCNIKPKGHIPLSTIFLICYTPMFFKEIFNVKFSITFKITAYTVAGIYYVYDLLKFLFYKLKYKKSKLDLYKKVFSNSEDEENINYYIKKQNDIINQTKSAEIGDKMLGLLFYFCKLLCLFLIISYVNIFIKQFDDDDFDNEWCLILIPIDIAGLFSIVYVMIFIYSIRNLDLEFIKKFYLNSAIIALGSFINLVLANFFFGKVTAYLIAGINFCITVSSIYYYIYHKKIEAKYEESVE